MVTCSNTSKPWWKPSQVNRNMYINMLVIYSKLTDEKIYVLFRQYLIHFCSFPCKISLAKHLAHAAISPCFPSVNWKLVMKWKYLPATNHHGIYSSLIWIYTKLIVGWVLKKTLFVNLFQRFQDEGFTTVGLSSE